MRLVVKGKIFTRGRFKQGSVLIEDGRIAKVKRDIREPVDEVLDYSGKSGHLVLPGLIDIHVHLRDFEQSYKEDFYTGTCAAAMGGFTIVADMPNTKPEVNEPKMLRMRDRVARSKAVVDYGLYYGVPDEVGHLREEIDDLSIGFKIFMHREFYTGERQLVLKTLEYAGRKKLLVMAHAENPKFFVRTKAGAVGTARAEASAIRDIAIQAIRYRFPLHVTHLSSASGLRESLKWKKKMGLTLDTCPHYLLLTRSDVELLGPIAKVEPSLKGSSDSKVLLEALRSGKIDAISSDHAPHSLDEKGDEALGGFPGLETTVPLLLTLVNKGLLGIEDLVAACSSNPSKILGLSKVGAIEEGMVGNLTIVDLHRKWRIDPSLFASKAKYSPFKGAEVEGAVVGTIVRGKPVMLGGRTLKAKGWGMNVKAYN